MAEVDEKPEHQMDDDQKPDPVPQETEAPQPPEEEKPREEEDEEMMKKDYDEDEERQKDEEDLRHRRSREEEPSSRKRKHETTSVTIDVDDDDAAFILGRGGLTKRKIARVSGAEIDLDEKRLQITMAGTPREVELAQDYVHFIRQQRVGKVAIDTVEERDDFGALRVPQDCIGFIMGRNGATLRSMEEEWGVMMCFATVKHPAFEGGESLCIFGPFRARRGAELKTMSAVEHKNPGYCIDGDTFVPPPTRVKGDEDPEDWGVDTVKLVDDDFSYALGAQGSTRKKLATASGCIIEYVGKLAVFLGTREERNRGQDYLRWLLEQRSGKSNVDGPEDRQDCTIVQVPGDAIAFLTGHRGESLRSIERASGTFIFADGDVRDHSSKEVERLFIFSHSQGARDHATDVVEQRVDDYRRGDRGDRGYRDDYPPPPRDRDYPPPKRGRYDDFRGPRDDYRNGPRDDYRNGPRDDYRGYDPPSRACWDYQKYNCFRGDSCKFSHNVPRDPSYAPRDRSRSRDRRRSRRDDYDDDYYDRRRGGGGRY